MDPWLVLAALVVLAGVFVVLPVGASVFAHWRRPYQLTCPRAGREARIKVAAARAAIGALFGRESAEVTRCSLWETVSGCRTECLALPPAALRPMRRGEPPPRAHPGPGFHTILVPLDGTPRGEAILDVVGALARAHEATARLLHVARPVEFLRPVAGSVPVFAGQVMAIIEGRMREYLARLEARLPGVRVEGVVRVGEPAEEIVEEAESAGADLIAMTRRHGDLLDRLRHRSVSRQVARTTTIPLLIVRTGGAAARSPALRGNGAVQAATPSP